MSPMNDDELRSPVLEVFRKVAPEADVESLDPERSFHDQFGIDSIDYLNFVIGLEERLGVRIAEIDYPKLSSLRGCLDYLGPRIGSAEPTTAP
jgi:acyl carrier protein